MSGTDLDTRLARIEERLDELEALLHQLLRQTRPVTDHHGLGRGGSSEEQGHA